MLGRWSWFGLGETTVLTGYLTRLATSDDKFAFVLGDPLLYRLAETPEGVTEFRRAVDAIEWSEKERWAIELGVIYVLRRYSFLDIADVLTWIDDMLLRCTDEQLRLRAVLTRLAMLSGRGEFDAAMKGFVRCLSESRRGDDHLGYALVCMGLAEVAMFLGDRGLAESSYESAFETFKR